MASRTCYPHWESLRRNHIATILCSIWLLFSGYGLLAQQPGPGTEYKVDYLERVYFSGQNKDGLNTQILIVLQELQDRALTASQTKQATFLADIQKKIPESADACEVLDMIAVGIYNLDAAEAVRQGVKTPSDKAKVRTFDALSSLNKLTTASKDVGTAARTVQWSSAATGSSADISGTAGRVANTANTVGNMATAAQQAGQTAKQLGDVGKSLGIGGKKKDKPCPDVPPKAIAIGEHNVQPAATAPSATAMTVSTVISIQGISSAALKSLTESLRQKPGVKSAEKSFNEQSSTVTVVHEGSTDALADWIEENFGTQFKMLNYAAGQISLASRAKK